MKRQVLAIVLSLFIQYGFSQTTRRELYIPHIVMSNGTIVDLCFNKETDKLDCSLFNNINNVSIVVEKDGRTIDIAVITTESGEAMFDFRDITAGNYDIVIKNDDEIIYAGNVEVTTDNN